MLPKKKIRAYLKLKHTLKAKFTFFSETKAELLFKVLYVFLRSHFCLTAAKEVLLDKALEAPKWYNLARLFKYIYYKKRLESNYS